MTEASTSSPNGILIEAESFASYGGWLVDSQFEDQMGSPYLLAHGAGTLVADAHTSVTIPEAGAWQVWVRTKDWTPPHGAGRFTLTIADTTLPTEFGTTGAAWAWQPGGTVELPAGDVGLTLHDGTGFDGRCDAIYLSNDGSEPVDGAGEDARAWRGALRGLPAEPTDAGHFDLVVVGGGIAGCAAALCAARLGTKVALIQDRPVLGGNASNEIGLTPRGTTGPIVAELAERSPDGDLAALGLLQAEGVEVFLSHRVFAARTDGARIVSVDARAERSGAEITVSGTVFADCTGTAIFGRLAGAATIAGQESQADYGEATAPEHGDAMHHGNTLFFRTQLADHPVDFPDVPWATEVAKDYANLSGQLTQPGVENGPGPKPGVNPADDPVFDFNDAEPGANPLMNFPATHFWEYGQWLDLYEDAEEIRDHLLRALYGTFWNVKHLDPTNYANLEFAWVAYVAAQGEFDRYLGDHVLTEGDIRDHVAFDDAVVCNDGAFCLHYPHQPGEGDYDFRLKDWVWDLRDSQPYVIPFGCLYSANIENLMMAGKHISVTHVAGSSTKFMGNGGQHGIAVGVAAHLCARHDTTPRGVAAAHLDQLTNLVSGFVDYGDLRTDPVTAPPLQNARAVAERHAQDVVDGNLERALGDFHGTALESFLATGALPPDPTTAYEILSETPGIEYVEFGVRYTNETEELILESRWQFLVGQWRITRAAPLQRAES